MRIDQASLGNAHNFQIHLLINTNYKILRQIMQALLKQAQTYHQQGQFSLAEEIYTKLLSGEPSNPLLNSRLALLLSQTQRPHDALKYISAAISAVPDHPDLLNQGVAIATSVGEYKLSESWLLKLISLKPNELSLKEQLAGVLVGNHKEEDALGLAKQIIKQSPNNANAYNLKGLALSRLGETDKGYKAFQKALKLNPGQLAVIKNLLIYGKGKKEPLLDKLIPQLEQNLLTQQQAPAIKMNIAYVLSMYFDKTKNPTKSFHYLKLGNDINRSNYQYSNATTQEQFNLFRRTFTTELKELFQGQGLVDDSPIFILGMPRSGTTLVEQVLSSHSLVEAEGEITDLKESFEKHSAILDIGLANKEKIESCLAAASNYLSAVKHRQEARYFTDKMPYNFMLVGLIALALPNAKIIHCTRDAMETCFSIYKQNFTGSHAYTNDLTELGQYYVEYQLLMDYWNELFPEKIYELNYERMVDSSEEEITKLLKYCGLESEPQCFNFHKNKRAVRTASVSQVRQPIYKDALKASSPYKKQLEPLAKALGLN